PSDPAGAPPTSTRPVDGRTSPHAIFVSVDLPAPFGPSSPTSSPSPTSRSTPPSASIGPYRLARPRTASAAGTFRAYTRPNAARIRRRAGGRGSAGAHRRPPAGRVPRPAAAAGSAARRVGRDRSESREALHRLGRRGRRGSAVRVG